MMSCYGIEDIWIKMKIMKIFTYIHMYMYKENIFNSKVKI